MLKFGIIDAVDDNTNDILNLSFATIDSFKNQSNRTHNSTGSDMTRIAAANFASGTWPAARSPPAAPSL